MKNILMKSLMCLAAVFLLTGCSKSNDKTNSSNTNESTNAEVTKDATVEDTSDAATYIVTDVVGDVEIPVNPQRIVDISGNSDILSVLGYTVIGTANSDAYDYTSFPSYLKDKLSGAQILGYSMQDTMDIEAIMALEPDLIIISTTQEKMYDELQDIAPTVMIQLEALDFKEDIRTIASIFQKEEEAEAWISNYETIAKKAGDAIKAEYGEDNTYLAFLASGGSFFIFDGAGFGNVLYSDMGLKKPANMPEQDNISLPVVDYEGLAAIDADYIFLIATEEDRAALYENSIWNSMRAVTNGNVVSLPSSPYFNQGYSCIGRELLINEISGMLADTNTGAN